MRVGMFGYFASIAFVFVSPLVASAGVTSFQSGQQPAATLPFTSVIDVPQFPPNAGKLVAVYVRVSVMINGTVSAENLTNHDVAPPCPDMYPGAIVHADYCGGGPSPVGSDYLSACIPPLGPFDGTVDFAGTSGTISGFGGAGSFGGSTSNIGDCGLPPATPCGVSAPAILDAFSGFGVVHLHISADPYGVTPLYATSPDWAFSMLISGQASAFVTYWYDDLPAGFCGHDGFQGNRCPCDSTVPYEYGFGSACPNSQNPDGALLHFNGQASLSADTFALTASGMPAQAVAMFFQGTNAAQQGVLFADGLRCVTGSIVRLGIKTASGGAATYPSGADLPISVRGNVPAPGSFRAYQVWYRDAAAFCTSATSNLSSGVLASWSP